MEASPGCLETGLCKLPKAPAVEGREDRTPKNFFKSPRSYKIQLKETKHRAVESV